MAQKRKRHLRYQQKKGKTVATGSGVDSEAVVDESVSSHQTDAPQKRTAEAKEFTKLPESETRFIRKELVYIALVALAVIVVYVGIFIVFRTTQLDEWLNSLIQLGSK